MSPIVPKGTSRPVQESPGRKLLEKKNSDDQAEKTGAKKNKIDKAVLFHLGNEIPEETEPNDEMITDRFVFCQITDLEDNSPE